MVPFQGSRPESVRFGCEREGSEPSAQKNSAIFFVSSLLDLPHLPKRCTNVSFGNIGIRIAGHVTDRHGCGESYRTLHAVMNMDLLPIEVQEQ